MKLVNSHILILIALFAFPELQMGLDSDSKVNSKTSSQDGKNDQQSSGNIYKKLYYGGHYQQIKVLASKNKQHSQEDLYYIGESYYNTGAYKRSIGFYLEAYSFRQKDKYRYLILSRFLELAYSPKFELSATSEQSISTLLFKDLNISRQKINKFELQLLFRIHLKVSKPNLLAKYLLQYKGVLQNKADVNQALQIVSTHVNDAAAETFLIYYKNNSIKLYLDVYTDFLWKKSRYQKLEKLLKSSYKTYNDFRYLQKLGFIQIEQNKKKEGFTTLDSILKHFKFSKFGYETVSEIYFNGGFYQKALDVINQGSKQHKLNLKLKKSEILLVLERYEAAFELLFESYIKSEITIQNLSGRLVKIIKEEKNLEILANFLNKKMGAGYFKQVKKNELNKYYIGLLLKKGQYHQSLLLAKNISVFEKDDGFYFLSQVESLIEDEIKGGAKTGLQLYRKDFKNNPKYFNYYISLNVRYLLLVEKYKEAGESIAELPKKYGKDEYYPIPVQQVYYWRGKIELHNGNWKNALEYFIAADKYGEEQSLRLTLGVGNIQLSKKILKKYKKSNKKFYQGLISIAQKDYYAAVNYFKSMIYNFDGEGQSTDSLFFLYLINKIFPRSFSSKKVPSSKSDQQGHDFLKLMATTRFGPFDKQLENINEFIDKNKKMQDYMHDFVYYTRAIYLIRKKKNNDALADLNYLAAKGRTTLLKSHVIFLQAKLKDSKHLEYLKEFSKSPYSFFAREHLKKAIP